MPEAPVPEASDSEAPEPEAGPATRRVTLVLCDDTGRPLGTLPPIDVAMPYWPEAWDIVAAAREIHGLDVIVLRLLATTPGMRTGGEVASLAEVAGSMPAPVAARLRPVDHGLAALLADHPLRMPWARPSGPSADVAWAEAELAAGDIARRGPARQVRTWNLSSIWELPLADGGSAWLKVVPPFFAHEGPMLRLLAGQRVPRLLASDGPRLLLAGIAGEDRYDASLEERLEMMAVLVGLQARFVGRVGELRSMGLPDWCGPALAASVEAVVARRAAELPGGVRAALRRLLDGMPARLDALASCGIPDTLVHGDAHPGNARAIPGRPDTLVLLDWGDCGVGNPLLDLATFLSSTPEADRETVRTAWLDAWRAQVPGCRPESAAALLAPLAAARQAVVYQRFLDGIEPAERVYHEADVPEWLERAADLVIAEG